MVLPLNYASPDGTLSLSLSLYFLLMRSVVEMCVCM